MVHLTVLFKIYETCPSASRAKQLLEGMQQNKHQNKSHRRLVCIVSEDVVQHFNKNTELETIFRVNSFCKLNHAQCNPSICTSHCHTFTNVSCSE